MELENFIKTYLSTFLHFTSNLSKPQKALLLPKYITNNCEIIGIISKSKGVSIRFNVTQNKESFRFQDTMKSIEDEVLPPLSSKGNIFFILDGQQQVLENMNLMTTEFYEKHKDLIEKLTRSTNFIRDKVEKFVDIVSGDLKLIDCTLAFCEKGKNVLDRIDCLWLFSSNRALDFSKSKAEFLATSEYKKLAAVLANRIPIETLIGTLSAYKNLIDSKNTTEPKMQTFFENNWTLLEMSAKRVFPKFNMGGENIPDFIIETSDFKYLIVEIESPNVTLYTLETPPRPSKKLFKTSSSTW